MLAENLRPVDYSYLLHDSCDASTKQELFSITIR